MADQDASTLEGAIGNGKGAWQGKFAPFVSAPGEFHLRTYRTGTSSALQTAVARYPQHIRRPLY